MVKTRRSIACCLGVVLWFVPLVWSQGLPAAAPKAVGLSQERLDRVTALMKEQVDDQRVAGAVALVARRGKVAYLHTEGRQDVAAGSPMKVDTVFRIASMSKPITSVAVLILYEEGRFQLTDPVSLYIPEFKEPKVLAPGPRQDRDPNGGVTRAKREITIKDLLTHTSGLAYHWDNRIATIYRDAGIPHGLLPEPNDLSVDIKKLARLPLVHNPGEAWTYGLSTDTLGYLVEVVSGMPLDAFLQQRIFRPLGMKDTCFFLPQEKVARLATAYAPQPGGGLKPLYDERVAEGGFAYCADYPVKGPRRYFSGGGGLCSTISDYARFAQMLLNKGQLDGMRILSRKTVELMTTDQVGPLSPQCGFGLGVSVARTLAESGELGSVGTYGWGGFWYTTFFVDPTEQMIGICMAQLHPDGEATLNKRFKTLAYQAIVD